MQLNMQIVRRFLDLWQMRMPRPETHWGNLGLDGYILEAAALFRSEVRLIYRLSLQWIVRLQIAQQ